MKGKAKGKRSKQLRQNKGEELKKREKKTGKPEVSIEVSRFNEFGVLMASADGCIEP